MCGAITVATAGLTAALGTTASADEGESQHGALVAGQLCQGETLDLQPGFEPLDPMTFIDAPTSSLVQASEPVDLSFLAKMIRGDLEPPLHKAFCHIGIQDVVIDYGHAAFDDAISAVIYRTIYRWNSDVEFPGWEIEAVGERSICARGREEETSLCL
ncbi:MAG: hypothetical protein AAFX09_08625 [Pseudomonadota bacterium]